MPRNEIGREMRAGAERESDDDEADEHRAVDDQRLPGSGPQIIGAPTQRFGRVAMN